MEKWITITYRMSMEKDFGQYHPMKSKQISNHRMCQKNDIFVPSSFMAFTFFCVTSNALQNVNDNKDNIVSERNRMYRILINDRWLNTQPMNIYARFAYFSSNRERKRKKRCWKNASYNNILSISHNGPFVAHTVRVFHFTKNFPPHILPGDNMVATRARQVNLTY